MAKIRRVIRKLKTPSSQGFDEQAWPVFMALVVLGGFVTGSILAYLRFDDPRWYANAVLWLLVALAAFAVAGVLLAVVNNRRVRRSMQLALLLGLLFHSVLFVSSIELKIFERIFDVFASNQDPREAPEPVTIPEYFQTAQRDRQRPDFQRPVETETPQPEPEPEPIEREETEPEQQPSEPQPTPVPEPEQTVRPNVVRREQPEETAPRQSEQQSQLSRRLTQSRPTPTSTAAESPQAATEPTARSSVRAQDASVARRETESQMQRRAVDQEPSTDSPQAASQLARRETRQSPESQSTATPAARRELNRPLDVPRTQIEVADTPTVSGRTRPDQLQPNTTLAQKQNTASPDRTRTEAEPVPDVTQSVTASPQRRELPTEQRPDIARTPNSVPNREARVTPRPEVTTAASDVTPTNTPRPPSERPTLVETPTSPVRRTTADTAIERPAVANEPASTTQQTATSIARRQTQQTPVAESNPSEVMTPRRQTTQPTVASSTQAQTTAPAAVANNNQSNTLQAGATETSRQVTANAAVARAMAEPSPAPPAASPTPVTAESPTRQPLAQEAPAIAQSPPSPSSRRSQVAPQPATATAATPVGAAAPQATQTAAAAAPAAASGSVQRTAPSAVAAPSPAAPDPAATAATAATSAAQPQLTRAQGASAAAPAPASPTIVAAATPRRSLAPSPAATAAAATAPAGAATPDATAGAASAVAASTNATRQATSGASTADPALPAAPGAAASMPAAASVAAGMARRQTTDGPATLAASAPATTPRRQTLSPSAVPDTSADAAGAPAASSPQTAANTQLAAARTAAARSATGGAAAGPSAASPAAADAPALAANSGAATSAATRQPAAPEAPTVAQGSTSMPVRRDSTTAMPGVATTAAEVAANVAPVQGTSNQPSPSLASVARQASQNATADRSQRAMDLPTASTATQVAQATSARADSAITPSIAPSNSSGSRPERSDLKSAIAASPTNVESPAMEQSTRGLGDPTAAAARTALTKSSSGTAGVGAGRNLDRARPAADSPAMVASASARRTESTQTAEAGPAMSPTAPSAVRRARTGADAPGASLQAEPIAQIATAAGSERPTELAANASAALTRSDANATQAPTTAAVGTAEVDLGPTRVVSEGETGRASGGGQPAMNFQTDAPQLARSDTVGGATLASVAADTLVNAPTAPAGSSPDQPMVPQTDVQPTSIARTDVGGGQPTSGGPSRASDTGPPTEVAMAEQVAEAGMSRAEAAEAAMGTPMTGGGDEDEEDEEERRRRLARAAAQLAIATDTSADAAPMAAGSGETGGGEQAASAAATSLARASMGQTSGGPLGGNDAAQPADAAAASVAAASGGRAEAAENTPAGPPIASLAGSGIGRAARSPAGPSTTVQAMPAGAASPATGDGRPSLDALAGSTSLTRTQTGAAGAAASAVGDVSLDASEPGGDLGGAALARAGGGPSGPDTSSPAAPAALGRTGRAGPTLSTATAVAMADVPATTPVTAAGGSPDMTGSGPAATSIARAETGASSGTAGGPADALPAPTGTDAATELAAAGVSRAQAAESAAGDPTEGGGSPTSDPVAALAAQIARRPGSGSPQLALAGPSTADLPTAPSTDAMAGGGASGAPTTGRQANPVATTTERMTGGGEPASGQLAAVTEAGPAGGASGGEMLANQFVRAEAVEGDSGPPAMGGGTGSPARAARGASFASSTQAEMVAMTGSPDSGGINNGSPIAAQGLEAARLAGGTRSPAALGPVGATRADTVVDVALIGQPGTSLGMRGASPSSDDGPEVMSPSNLGAALPRAATTNLPDGPAALAMVDVPGGGSLDPDPNALASNMGDAAGDLAMSRQSTEGGLSVEMDAIDGPGGLGAEFTVDVGLDSRRALAESIRVQMRAARFVRHDVGGLPDFSTSAVVAAEPFRRRLSRGGEDGGPGGGSPPPLTEESVELGLAFLARQQLQDGSWSLQSISNEPAALVTDTAATGLALLAFQGAGYNHREHKYAEVVNAGLQYLLDHQQPSGDLFIPLDDDSNRSVWLYSHSIGAIVLSEAYGMTQDPELRDPAQRAIDFIVDSQSPERGGWRYSPQTGSDTSVTGWMMMALKSGELAGLEVPEKTYDGIREWLDDSQQRSQPHLYRYNPLAPDTAEQRHGRDPSKTMTAVGLLMRLYSGWRRDNPNMANGAEYLSQHLPSLGSERNPERDTYYWYYATQVMFHMGGEYWEQWNGQLHPLLVGTQVQQGPMAGSWHPRTPVPDRWAPHAGRLYVTAMNLLSLEVYYRHLPLYEDTAR